MNQSRGLDRFPPFQVLDRRDPQLGLCDQDVAKGGRKDAVGEHAAPEVSEPRVQSIPGPGQLLVREHLVLEDGHRPVQVLVPEEIPPTGPADAHVALHAPPRLLRGLTARLPA
jgi:hypothetical protein